MIPAAAGRNIRTAAIPGAVIGPSPTKRLAAQAFATIFAKFWGYSLLWADTRDAAIDMAAALLAEAALPDAAE